MASSTMEEAKLPGGYLVTPRVPQGLAAAVEGLTREVIRHSPEDIYVFAAHHFEKLLELREQCGMVKEKSSNRDGRMDTLREVNRALREREVDRENVKAAKNTMDPVGWSLNQTAKVLKRHRSIFGDEGRRITTDEVFQMATRKGNGSRSPKSPTKKMENREKRSAKEKTSAQKSDDVWKASTSRAEDSIDDENADKTKTGPKIITQISNLPSGNVMLAKDIKTELRRNRISSRERRNVRARHEGKDTMERADSKVVRSSGKNCSTKKSLDRQKRIETDVEEKHSRKNYDSTRSSSSSKEFQHAGKSHNRDGSRSNKENAKTRTSSMDRVRDYVIEKFATTKSLEELQTLDYIEKVQKIIDETGPIIRDKVDRLKSGMIDGPDGNSSVPDTRKIRERRFDDSPRDKNEGLSERKCSSGISPPEISTNDALITRLAETRNLMENVSSSLTKSSRRSRSARSSRRSENFRINDETLEDSPRVSTIAFENRDNGLETKLSRTRDLLKDISSSLSRPVRRSCSATSLNKRCETMEDVAENRDALKKRLDETRNLLKGISASFGKFTGEKSTNKMTIDSEESFGPGEENLSKSSLPAVKSASVKNSSSSVSRSDSGNLVLPAISPEVPKSSKIKEDLILPILSPPSTASTNEDSGKILDINDDVPLKDFGIPETPVDYIPEVPVDNVSRDSLNVTPDFDSIPQRPDSLEPVEVIDDLETNGPEVSDLEVKSKPADELREVDPEIDDLETNGPAVSDLEMESEPAEGLRKVDPGIDDLEKNEPEMSDLEGQSVDSIPQRPDSLEPVEVIDGLETNGPELSDLEVKSKPADDLGKVDSDIDDPQTKIPDNDNPQTIAVVDELGARTLDVNEDHISNARFETSQTETINSDDLQAKTTITDDPLPETSSFPDLAARLQEIQKVEMDIEEIFGSQTKSDSQKSENSDVLNKLRELENVKTHDTTASRMDNPAEDKESEEHPEMPVDIIEMPENSGKNVEEEMRVEEDQSKPGEDDVTEEEDKIGFGHGDDDKLENISPEPVNYTYVLTEGSPYDIPDTVTTVIIPERIIDSPLSDRLHVELEDGVGAKLSLLSDHSKEEKSIRNNADENIERDDEDSLNPDFVDEPMKDSNEIDTISSLDSEAKLFLASDLETDEKSIDHIIEKSIEHIDEDFVEPDVVIETTEESNVIVEIPANLPESSDKDDSSSRNMLDPFGELVKPESITEISSDIDFIRELENIPEIQMSHQDLGPINEEVIEELEEFEEKREKTIDDNAKAKGDEEASTKEIEIFKEEKEEEGENGEKKTYLEIDESRMIESDLSPEGTRPSVCSESSNETKESSAADEALESTKRERSMDDEVSSDTRTAESSNEVKETTLTDGLSLSLDPSRPYVPELNLDSLQDITVSSFKMTDGDNDNQEPGESENTNSITETLTSDENNRINDSREFMEEAVVEYLPSSSSRSKSNEIDDETEKREKEVEEETIVKRRVEVKEDICEKKSTYVTGPGGEGINIDDNQVESLGIEQGREEQKGNSAITEREEEDTTKEGIEKEILCETKTVEYVETDKLEKEEEKTQRREEEIAKTEDSKQMENANIVETEEETNNDESCEGMIDKKPDAASGEAKLDLDVKSSEEKKNGGESSEDTIEKEAASGKEKLELDVEKSTEDESRSSEKNFSTKSEISEPPTKEEIVHDLDAARLSSEVGKSNEGMQVEEEESEDALEENDVDEETPLAVSRSASQCTTRRVSSGNLAKLRDNPTLEPIDKIDDQDEKSEHDSSSSKVKFTDETSEEEGRQKTEGNLPSPRNDRTDDDATVKDGKEYHIYVPEVDASEDYSTTESSTFDSAVTKIQAGVRGFLTRRRLQRGQENRSSTLSSIPSIQDSEGIEPYRAEDRAHEASEDKDLSGDKTGMASLKVSRDNDLVDAATRIQSNYRGYKARKRLRRENAVQRTTISLEKSFGESGLQHTGEFHDCIPLPIHDITIGKKISDPPIEGKLMNEPDFSMREKTNPEDNFDELDETTVKSSTLLDPGKIIFAHSSNDPIIQFKVGPNVSQLVDLVVLAQNDDALQTGYLNFITSVEDTETIVEPTEVGTKSLREDESMSRESLREPLALSGPPVGLIIEEITSSGPEDFMKIDEEPEAKEESLNPPGIASATAPEVSESMEDRQSAEQLEEQFQIDRKGTGSHEIPNERCEDAGVSEKVPDRVIADRAMAPTFNPAESVPLDSEPLIEDFILPTSLSSIQEKELLGPESCVDSMEHPVVQIANEPVPTSTDSAIRKMTSTGKGRVPSVENDRPDLSEVTDDRIKEEESISSNVADGSSKVSLSMKVEDLLDLGSEGNIDLIGKKPVPEGTLKPNDLVKSMGLSQDSQLADERIESPVTMIQIAPERIESLQHDDLSDKSGDEDTNNGEKDRCSSTASESKKK